jgi:hypothetical protein
MNNIVIYGASGLGKEILQLLKVINNEKNYWNIQGFIDDNKNQRTVYYPMLPHFKAVTP